MPAQMVEGTKGRSMSRDRGRTLGMIGLVGLGVYLAILGMLLGSLVVALWPVIEGLGQPGASEGSLRWLGVEFSVTPEGAFLLLVILFGAIGAYIHAATSFVDYAGNRKFTASWTWWYVLRPFVGMALALIFYVTIRGGFFAQEAQTEDVNPFGIAALAGLSGLFSKQATDKLREVFDTMFRTEHGRGDDERSDPLTARTGADRHEAAVREGSTVSIPDQATGVELPGVSRVGEELATLEVKAKASPAPADQTTAPFESAAEDGPGRD
jgi:hypothetical protein